VLTSYLVAWATFFASRSLVDSDLSSDDNCPRPEWQG
jgi:hypothetical protein